MKNKKSLFALTAMFIVTVISAQDQQPLKVKEYGIGLYGLNNFSLQYRWGNENRLFRFSGNLGANSSLGSSETQQMPVQYLQSYTLSSTAQTRTPINMNFGLAFSLLKIKSLTDNFGLVYGPMIGTGYQHHSSEITTLFTNVSTYNNYPNSYTTSSTSDVTKKTIRHTLTPHLGFVFGVVYKINPSFLVYGEIAPNIFYSHSETKESTTSKTGSSPIKSSMFDQSIGISNISNSGAMISLVYRITK